MNKFLPLLLACLLFACDSGDSQKKASAGREIKSPAIQQTISAPKEDAAPPPGQADIEKADRLLAYSNRAQEALDDSWHGQAERLYANSRSYLESFSLPKKPPGGRKPDLKPESGIFNEQEEALIASGLAGMDRALDRLLGYYGELEKYVADDSVRDDGRLGRQIAKRIAAARGDYIASRDSWLAIVQKRAAEAEKILLYNHPLQRQILAGSAIMAQIREVGAILATDTPEKAMLAACRGNIADQIALGEKPPFPAKPASERLYRAFLKAAQAYGDCLARGINEGFFDVQKRELAEAGRNCVQAWNEFAKDANSRG